MILVMTVTMTMGSSIMESMDSTGQGGIVHWGHPTDIHNCDIHTLDYLWILPVLPLKAIAGRIHSTPVSGYTHRVKTLHALVQTIHPGSWIRGR